MKDLDTSMTIQDYSTLIERIGEYDIFVITKDEYAPILEYVDGVPDKSEERATKENNIEMIIINYNNETYCTSSETRIGELISAAMDDLEVREELRERAAQFGVNILY